MGTDTDRRTITGAKKGLTIATISTLISTTMAIGGAFWTVEDRYVTKTELSEKIEQLSNKFERGQSEIISKGRGLFILQYQDTIEDLEIKMSLSSDPSEKAYLKGKIERLKAHLEDIRQGNL